MSDPVVVYLDSQDFSRFSPSHPDHSAYLCIKQELLGLKQEGAARFVFSDVHVFENLPVSYKNSAPGLGRIRTIAELCGQDHLPSSTTLVEHELRQLAGGGAPLWPEWYPYFEMEEPDRGEIQSNLIAKMASNRSQRRAIAKALKGAPDVRLNQIFADEFLSRYPFLQGGKKTLTAYLARQVGWDAVETLLRTGLRDIAGFSEWLVENWKHGRAFVGNLRDQNLHIQTTLTNLYTKMRALFERASLSQEDATHLIKSTYDKQREQFLERFAAKNSLKLLGQEAHGPLTQEQTPSLFVAMHFLMDVAYLSALPKDPRNPKKHAGSDFADAMHVLFLPRVDIFRADQFSCSVLRKNALNGTTTLCPSLQDLPALIRGEAKKRSEVG